MDITTERDKSDFEELKRTVEELHVCEASYISTQHVRETFRGTALWDGAVSIFGLTGHAAATTCYAWSDHEPGSGARSFYAVLHLAPIESARDAVRASLAIKHRVKPG